MANDSNFVWDVNEQNMIPPTQDLFNDGYDADAVPTSSNINFLFNKLSISRTAVGTIDGFMGAAAPDGWLLCKGETVAKSNTAASYYGDEYEDIFIVLWENFAQAVVSPSKGATAAADWAADKTITLPDMQGNTLAGANAVTGSIFNAPTGTFVGEENVTLTTDQIPQLTFTANDPQHDHITDVIGRKVANSTVADWYAPELNVTSGDITTTSTSRNSPTGITINPLGGGQAHNNVPPSLLINFCIKY